MAEAKKKKTVSTWHKVLGYIGLAAFCVGLVLAIVYGIVSRDNAGVILTLVIMGIIVGFLNVTRREIIPLLVAAIALIVVGKTSFSALNDLVSGLGTSLNSIVGYLAAFMAPAAVISAVRAMWGVARPGESD